MMVTLFNNSWIIVPFFLLLFGTPGTSGYTYLDEEGVRAEILTNYSKHVPPSVPLEVRLGMVPLALNYLDIGVQEMCLTAVLQTTWNDSRLMWTEADHQGVAAILLAYGTAWLPTLVISNAVDKIGLVGQSEAAPTRVLSNGQIIWSTPCLIKVVCEMKIQKFPFDTQTCAISIIVWGYDRSEVYVSVDDRHLNDQYNPNGEWDMIGSEDSYAMVNDGYYVYQKLLHSITFKRKWLFLGLTLLVPAILNSLLMCAVFALPFESGEKMGYSLTVLLTYIVLLTLVADSLPPISTDISVLQIYLTAVMCLGTVSTLLTVWTVTVYNQSPNKPIPHWVVFFCSQALQPLTCASCCFWLKCGCCHKCRPKNRKVSVSPADGATFSCTTRVPVAAEDRTRRFADNEENGMVSDLDKEHPRSGEIEAATKGFQYTGKDSTKRDSRNQLEEPPPYQERNGVKSPSPRFEPNRKSTDKDRFQILEDSPEATSSDDDEELTWARVAELMDAVFLRLISAIILLGTFILLVYYAANY